MGHVQHIVIPESENVLLCNSFIRFLLIGDLPLNLGSYSPTHTGR